MIEVGDVVEIGGKEATVCYTTVYNNHKYMCVAFEDGQLHYDVYDYLDDDGRLQVAKVTEEAELTPVLGIFLQEGLEEYGLPEELQEVFDNMDNNTQ